MNELPPSSPGAVSGSVRVWLRTEGFSVAALSALLYGGSGHSWWIFIALLLTPDLSMLAYLINPKAGAICYNVVHSYFLPLISGFVAVAFHRSEVLPYLFIWTAHIGLDRLLGYGLKYETSFGRTHVGHLTQAVKL